MTRVLVATGDRGRTTTHETNTEETVGSSLAPLLLTATQAASALGVGKTKLYELIKEGSLQPVHIGRSVRFPLEDVALFVRRLRDVQGIG
jgi:excisionase family DNA binding protein